ncbi:ankyrin repeat and SOCS box protein 1-like [Gigantopelta aegis]|uniref:ankyrin repeat and SOCS box protein 1-like n=1 Tax=Gigantopelta aegis TaxID=1735272 RepID=UPI001B88ADEE|nr:ankyrin repeat and SOCS box protein 1-like [Gigantopelta aegis]XP_041372321.1 ankyrin repeat and SOCS box protein 1-like [Gigantopelta aegis]
MISLAIADRFRDCHFSISDTVLHETAFVGDHHQLSKLLLNPEVRGQINKKNHLGCTALRLAATGGHTECVEILLREGANIDIPDVKAQTPLFVAVKNNHTETAHALLQQGADPEGDLENNTSPIYTACMNGCIHLVKLLIDYNAYLGHRCRINRLFSMDPLQICVVYQQYDCLKLLLHSGADPNFQVTSLNSRPGMPSLYHFALRQHCDVGVFKLLYEFGTKLHVKDERGRFPWDVPTSGVSEHPDDVIDYLIHIRDVPRSLLSSCRLQLHRSAGARWKNKDLSIPSSVAAYLAFEDV